MYQENYEMLASAIVVQAAKDYRRAATPQMRNTLKRFFFSEWFRTLTDANRQARYVRICKVIMRSIVPSSPLSMKVR